MAGKNLYNVTIRSEKNGERYYYKVAADLAQEVEQKIFSFLAKKYAKSAPFVLLKAELIENYLP